MFEHVKIQEYLGISSVLYEPWPCYTCDPWSKHTPLRGVVVGCQSRVLPASWSEPSPGFWTGLQRSAGCRRSGTHTRPSPLYCCWRQEQWRLSDQYVTVDIEYRNTHAEMLQIKNHKSDLFFTKDARFTIDVHFHIGKLQYIFGFCPNVQFQQNNI